MLFCGSSARVGRVRAQRQREDDNDGTLHLRTTGAMDEYMTGRTTSPHACSSSSSGWAADIVGVFTGFYTSSSIVLFYSPLFARA